MRASYRRHVVLRALTRTRVLVAAFVLVVVVVLALDTSHQPRGCHFVKTYEGYGSYTATRVCPGHGMGDEPTRSVFRRAIADWLLVVQMTPAIVLACLVAVRSWRAVELRRARRR